MKGKFYLRCLVVTIILVFTKCKYLRNSSSKHKKEAKTQNNSPSRSLRLTLKQKQSDTLNKLQEPRSLAGQTSPVFSSDMLGASAAPQVDAPRLLVKNFPKPTDVNYLYPKKDTMSGATTNAPMTVLPARVVDGKDSKGYASAMDPKMILNRALNKNKKGRNRKNKRGLSVSPYMNMGPGFMDIGQSGVSPMGMAMSNPDLPSLSPFLPRASPPPPIRIQMRDPVSEKTMRNTLTQSEYQVSDLKRVQLQRTLIDEIQGLRQDMQNKAKTLADQFMEIKNEVQQIKENKLNVETETKGLMAKIYAKK